MAVIKPKLALFERIPEIETCVLTACENPPSLLIHPITAEREIIPLSAT